MHQVELRPGYLGIWIEIHALDLDLNYICEYKRRIMSSRVTRSKKVKIAPILFSPAKTTEISVGVHQNTNTEMTLVN
jgi:hypothetical protein